VEGAFMGGVKPKLYVEHQPCASCDGVGLTRKANEDGILVYYCQACMKTKLSAALPKQHQAPIAAYEVKIAGIMFEAKPIFVSYPFSKRLGIVSKLQSYGLNQQEISDRLGITIVSVSYYQKRIAMFNSMRQVARKILP
jgi:DNA-binding CsgD family transcriptional regulator